MRIIYPSFLAVLLCLSSVVLAQPIPVKGKVINDAGNAVRGISIIEKGTTKAASTDSAGMFSIVVSKLPVTLSFTGVGFEGFEYLVTEKNKEAIAVTLQTSRAALEDVVVAGYGTTRRHALVGSTSIAATKSVSVRLAGPEVKRRTGTIYMKSPAPVKNQASRSKVLTAGEVSDFKKWKLWSDYSETEFKTWSEHWGIATKKRYCVQVQNQEHKAMVSEKVYLVNYRTKDTVWQAVTDNTGKAELWADLNNEQSERPTYSIVCQNQVISSPVLFEDGINRITLKKSCNISNMVDIAFVVDATGSMGDEIQYLQDELQDIISKTADKYTSIKLRTASVFYRDHGDEYVTRYNDFQTDPSNLIRFIKKQYAAGGGDIPEAVEDALTTAMDSLQWNENAHSKILFLILDAPPHDAAKAKMNVLIRKSATKGIRIVPVVCSGIDKSTEYLMRCVALATNGSYVFLTDDSGIGNPHIKPTTDEFTVELLNALLQRLIGEMIYLPSCDQQKRAEPVNEPGNKEVRIVVYPNPTRGDLTIELTGQIKEIFITDFTAKVLMRIDTANKKNKLKIGLGNYPSGTYLVKYFTEEKGWGVEKVVLIH